MNTLLWTVVMEGFMHGNVDNFICEDKRIFLIKDVRVT